MKIGELAEKTGCKVVTIRFYEKEGLLAEPTRTESNYRSYGKSDLERLEFIMHCRTQGMKLKCIKNFLIFRDTPHLDCTWMRERIKGFIVDVETRMASLEGLRNYFEKLLKRCDNAQGDTSCDVMERSRDTDPGVSSDTCDISIENKKTGRKQGFRIEP